MQNALDFQKSITEELSIIRDRVRYLIGDRHYGEDGRYKEAILKNIIRKFLPTNISIGTGFIVSTGKGDKISRQLDIILYDNTRPVLFSEGDFIITTSYNVRGIIEVKTRMTTGNLRTVVNSFDQAIDGLISPPTRHGFVTGGRNPIGIQKTQVFLGIFAFAFAGRISARQDSVFCGSRKYINHIALGPDKFIKKWKKEDGRHLSPIVDAESDFYNIYGLDGLAFSYFISNLIDIVSGGLNDRYWFAFPIENTKETRRERTIFV